MGLLILFASAAVLLTAGGTVVLIHRLQHPKRRTYAFALANGLPGDPGELGLRFTEKQFGFSDGSTTAGWVIEGACATGPIVILSHGWSSCRHGALDRVPLLAPFACRLVVYDLRGHGESTARSCRVGTSEAVDLSEILDQLDDTDKPVVLVGSSMGAGAAIATAAVGRNRKRITAVIAEGPYRHFREPIANHLRCLGLPAFPMSHLATAFMALRLGGLGQFDRAALAGRVTCPLLVLHGTADPVCSINSGRQIAGAAPRGRLVEFPGAGHGNLAAVDEATYKDAITALLVPIRDVV